MPGYWLGPAVEAVRGLAAGSPDEGILAKAMALDERRTSLFLCLALAALGRRNEVRTQWLDSAFGKLAADGAITRAQRALWTTAARGGFGAEGVEAIIRRLKVPSTAATQRWASHVENRAAKVATTGPAFKEIANQAKARAQLSRLRSAVEAITDDTTVLEPDGDLAYAADEKPDPDSTSAVLRKLIGEGSEPERDALARVAELQSQVSPGGEPAVGGIDDSAGTIDKLLEADLGNTDEPHLAATALRVVATGVLADAEVLAQTASLPSPYQVSTEIEWRPVTLLPDGPERQSLAAAEAAIASTAQPLSVRDLRGALALGAIALVVGIGFGLINPYWILAAVAILAAAANSYWSARKKRAGEQAETVSRIAKLRQQADQQAAELTAYRRGDRDRAAAAAADVQELRKRLAA